MARFKDYAASVGGTRTDQMSLPPWEIKVQPGFNPRDPESPEVKEYVREWAEKILSGGWNPAYAFLIRWDGEAAWMREGHCRQQGIALATDPDFRAEWERRTGIKGAPAPELVKCDLTPAATNEVDDLYIPLSSQERLPLTPAGWMEQIDKLVRAGQTREMIVRRLGQAAARMIRLGEAPEEVKAAVKAGAIKPTLADSALREHGRGGGTAIIKDAIEAGGGRARPRHVREVTERPATPRTDPPSLCSFAVAAYLAWERGTGHDAEMKAMGEWIGAPTLDAARVKRREAA
jgi:hypothetical protein